MQAGRCDKCSKPALVGKSHCLDHHKEQEKYAYGMDHELQKKMEAKYDPAKAQAVRVWIEAVTKKSLSNDLVASLKSGTVLCELVNAIFPNSVAKINTGAMPFVQRENIVAYLDACKRQGIRETDSFVTGDLYEGSNIQAVIDQLCALGHLAHAKGYRGPALVISAGAVQVASPQGKIAAASSTQVPLVEPKYQQPVTHAGSTASYKTAPSMQSPPVAASSSSSYSASKPTASSSSGGSSGAAKFCGGCGKARSDMSAKFCGGCGKAY